VKQKPYTAALASRPAVELCCGLGGISLGLRELGFFIQHAYDSWDEAVKIYNHNSSAPNASVCDLLSPEGRKKVSDDFQRTGEIELLAAGPPCQGFSQLRNGRNVGDNPQNKVLAAMPDYVSLLRPRLVLLENVPSLALHGDGTTLRNILKRLERPGPRGLRYRVEYKVYDTAFFGVPQSRRRILILAVRHGSGEESLPPPGPDLRPLYAALRHGGNVPAELCSFVSLLKNPDDLTLTSAKHALSDLPDLGQGQHEEPRFYRSEPESAFQRLMRRTGQPLVNSTRTPEVRTETVSRLRRIKPGDCARYIPTKFLNGLSRRYDSAYRRLHPDAPSTALSTRYDCIYHYARERSLSVRVYPPQGIRSLRIPDHYMRAAYE
jgi:DNA (cytosine-5)-methyltransferase 1